MTAGSGTPGAGGGGYRVLQDAKGFRHCHGNGTLVFAYEGHGMLYYRLYKRMRRSFGFHSAITLSWDYVTFVVLIPTGVGLAVSKALETVFGLSETLSYVSIFAWMALAALYIHLCSRRDKEP